MGCILLMMMAFMVLVMMVFVVVFMVFVVFSMMMLIVVLVEWESIQQGLLDPLVLNILQIVRVFSFRLEERILDPWREVLGLSGGLGQDYLHLTWLCLTVPYKE